MTNTESHHPPPLNRVMREQLKVTALSLRLPAIVLTAITAVVTMLVVANSLHGHGGVEFAPELSFIPALAAALLPIAVWQSERRFGAGFMWTLPVDRIRHALAKVLAGWLMLMIAVTVFVLWLLVLALITSGNINGDGMIRLLQSSVVPPGEMLDPSMLRTVQWNPQRMLWLAPFFAATAVYALASAIALGLRYPFRWIIGAIATVYLIAAVGQGIADDQFWLLSGKVINTLLEGRYGIDALLSGRTESLKTMVTLSNGQTASVWRALPALSDWIVATLLWTALGIAALSAALTRHRERR